MRTMIATLGLLLLGAATAHADMQADGVPVTPYVAGAISLSAQRAKYPSLYPGSYVNGGL